MLSWDDAARPDAWQRLERAGLPEGKVEVLELPRAQHRRRHPQQRAAGPLPLHRVRRRDGTLYELRVGLETDARRRGSDAAAVSSSISRSWCLPAELRGGVVPAAPAWTVGCRRLHVAVADAGLWLCVEQLYAPWRKRGTLLTFYRHTSGDDPYARVGRQDITASVDFTSVQRAGEAAGLKTLVLGTQAGYLASLGIGEALATGPSGSEIEAYYALRRAVIELTDASGLGRIRVMIQQK